MTGQRTEAFPKHHQPTIVLRREERVEVDGHAGQRLRTHDSLSVDRFGIGAIGLSAPGGECSFVRMVIPDFQVVALLLGGQF
ncbi:MAG: hypothetical protein KY456_15125, partial [Chloroflexi bacterium]|nr:hypothetical protein [Chloroflexota bacterium]